MFLKELIVAYILCAIEVRSSEPPTAADTCTYTFQVARAAGVQCNPAGSEDTSYRPAENGSSGGVVYTIWGSAGCPEGATQVYEGYMGKSHYTRGGGVNYLCLPSEPEFRDEVAAGRQSQSYMYGVEYQKHSSPFVSDDVHNHDAPCAVCEVTRNKHIMIPAKLSCPAGWTLEYSGMLMAQHYTHKGSTFVCVSNDMETVDGGINNNDGGLLYVVEGVCGSLKCPPYVDGYELSCVVCTK